MIEPANINLDCFIGGTWSEPFEFFDDDALTVPHDFSGWTPAIKIFLNDGTEVNGTATLGTTGVINASLSSTQTNSFNEQAARYAVTITENGSNPSNIEFLVYGTLQIKAI